LARKVAKSRRRITSLRSKTTKARTHVNRLRAANADLKKKLAEALGQQRATSEVLQVISSSPGDLGVVFQKMLEKATRACDAKFGTMYLFEGGAFRNVALHNAPAAFAEERRRNPVLRPNPGTGLGRVASTKQTVQIADAQAEPAYHSDPARAAFLHLAGARTFLTVPMLKEGELVGVISIYRQEVRPFTDKQIELVSNFASQAVIAIENTRLLNELRQRTDDLSESLEQQTATSEVLSVISSSPGKLEPVFETMLANATRICEARFGNLLLYDGTAFRVAAMHAAPAAWATQRGTVIRPDPRSSLGRVARTKEVVHTHDLRTTEPYLEGNSAVRSLADRAGARTLVTVPLLKENELIGVIGIYRQEVLPFTDKQIELVKNFAAQAVIAIENARLLNELRQRTDDLSEALEQQTATSEVLQVISSSPGELEPVFRGVLENATRICEAKFGVMFYYQDGPLRPAAELNVPTAYSEFMRQRGPHQLAAGSTFEHVLRTKQPVCLADAAAEGQFFSNNAARFGGARSYMAVPMLKEGEAIGAIAIYRDEVRPFSDKQVELVSNFAKQAVIAIENTRLLNELRESLQQQTATAEVLQVISASPGELEPVFGALLKNAVRLCASNFGNLYLREGELFRIAAWHNTPPDFVERRRGETYYPGPNSPPGRMLRTRSVVHVADLLNDASYSERDPGVVAGVELAGIRTIVIVPMLKEGEPIGYLSLYRQEVQPFSDKQIELLENFAAQAVIAIENTRLLNELRESLAQQTATSEVLQVISSSTGELEPVFSSMLANATRLCDANFGSLYLCEGDAFRITAMHNAPAAYEQLRRSKPLVHPSNPAVRAILGRLAGTKATVHIADLMAEPPEVQGALVNLANARTLAAVPMLKDGEPIVRLSSTGRKCGRSQISRSNWSPISPSRPSSPSRILDCSTSCANRYSSRPRPPTCSRSSAARRSTFRSCSIRSSDLQLVSARQIAPSFGNSKIMDFNWRR